MPNIEIRSVCYSALTTATLFALIGQPLKVPNRTLTLFGTVAGFQGNNGETELDFQFKNPRTGELVDVQKATAVFKNKGFFVDLVASKLPPDVYELTILKSGSPIAAATFVTLQATTPGSKEIGNINISGTILASKIGIGTTAPNYPVTVLNSANTIGILSKTGGRGIFGQSTNATTGYGGYFTASGSTSRGIYAESTTSSTSQSFGGQFVSKGVAGIGAYGVNSGAGDRGIGVMGEQTSGGIGVKGKAPFASGLAGSPPIGGYFQGGYGVFATGDVNCVYGRTSNANAVVFKAINDGKSSNVEIAGPNGAVNVGDGQVVKQFNGFNAGASPIGYAYFDSSGNKLTGTNNISASYNTSNKIYTISITGESLSIVTHVVQLTGGSYRTSYYNSGAGSVTVGWKDDTATNQSNDFSVMIYRTGAPLGPTDFPKHNYKSDKEWMAKDPAGVAKYLQSRQPFGTPVVPSPPDSKSAPN